MALSTITLDCTGTGNATVKRDPARLLAATATGTTSVIRKPLRTLTSTASNSPVVIKTTIKVLRGVIVATSVVKYFSTGVSYFLELFAQRRWKLEVVARRWTIASIRRFITSVRGY